MLRSILILVALTSGWSALSAVAQPLETDHLTIPFTIKNGLPFVAATVSDRHFDLYVDLGGYAAIALSPSALAMIAVESQPGNDRYLDALGNSTTVPRYLLPDVIVAGRQFESPRFLWRLVG